MTYQIERTSEEVLTVRHSGIQAGWEQRYLLISDVHFDSPHCDRKLLTKHLETAKSSNAGVICVGDWFDAMGGKSDKRANKSTIRPDNTVDNYFDSLVDCSLDYLAPYKLHLVMLSNGNHETAILKHNETDLLHRLTRQLNTQHMGYSGFIRFMFEATSKTGTAHNRTSRHLYFHHGSGGGGPVTKGTPAAHRRAASVDADIFVSGHIHEAWYLENTKKRCSDSGRVLYITQMHVQIPTYKQEAGHNGYHEEKGRPAKPLGGWWLIFHYDNTQTGNVGYRLERAN